MGRLRPAEALLGDADGIVRDGALGGIGRDVWRPGCRRHAGVSGHAVSGDPVAAYTMARAAPPTISSSVPGNSPRRWSSPSPPRAGPHQPPVGERRHLGRRVPHEHVDHDPQGSRGGGAALSIARTAGRSATRRPGWPPGSRRTCEEPGRGGMPVRLSRNWVIRIARAGSRRMSPANVTGCWSPEALLERGDDRERAEVHEGVGRAVVQQALEAGLLSGGKAARPRACSRCGAIDE